VEGVVKREPPGEEPGDEARRMTRRVAPVLLHLTPRVCPGVNAGQAGTRGAAAHEVIHVPLQVPGLIHARKFPAFPTDILRVPS
jgi:hypothetical protein